MENKYTIAFDFDDVINPVNKRIYNLLFSLGKGHLLPKYNDIQWGFKGCPQEVVDFAEDLYGDPDFMHLIGDGVWFENIRRMINSLKDAGHNVIIISSVYESCIKRRISFINEYFKVPYVFTNNKGDYKVDLIIEDSLKNVREVGATVSILVDQPWNQTKEENEYLRIYKHEDIEEVFKEALRLLDEDSKEFKF